MLALLEQFVHQDANAPDVHSLTVDTLLDDLRSHVVHAAASLLQLFVRVITEAKVNDLDLVHVAFTAHHDVL